MAQSKGKSSKKNRGRAKANDQVRRRPVEPANPDYRRGLTREQVSERMARGWDNHTVNASVKTTGKIIRENIFTYFNLIFLIVTVLLIIAHSYSDLTFLIVIVTNTVIGIAEEIYAKNELDKLSMLDVPKATVVRDGKLYNVATEQLVRDDIVLFRQGNQICADARVVTGEVNVNESLLTGETDEIVKMAGDTLISGSYVVSGECYAQLTAVGQDSYIAKLTLEAKAMKQGEQSQIFRALNHLLIFVGIALVPIGIILFLESFIINDIGFAGSVTSMVAAVIGMIPEGLFLLTSVALALSAVRLSRYKVLFHDLKSIETLARVDVLCLDKTGTITENSMKVKKLVKSKDYDSMGLPDLELLLGDFAHAMHADNITMEAIKEYYTGWTGQRAVSMIPFSSELKYSAVEFMSGNFVLGAPEIVLRELYPTYENRIRRYMARGYRVLAFAAYRGRLDGGPLTAPVTPLGFILLANPVREDAPETFSYFARQGVAIKVISGDNPMTVSEVAREAQIEGADRYIDARDIQTQDDIDFAVENYTVFGRVTPDQKREFIKALKKQGHTVAMTGDGVNDVLALKDADCSVAMASGSEVAAQVAQVVLLESNFSCMPEVVREGRRVVNNIQRSGSLFLVRNTFSLMLAVFMGCFMITYPLSPSQITLISMFTIGVPAFLLALQENDEPIKGRFLPNILYRALPAGITDFLAVGALVIFGQVFGVDSDDIATASTMLLAIVGFIVLIKLAGPMDRIKWIVWFCCIGAMLFCFLALPDLFNITRFRDMSLQCILLFVVFAIATEPILRLMTWIFEQLRELLTKFREQIRQRRSARQE